LGFCRIFRTASRPYRRHRRTSRELNRRTARTLDLPPFRAAADRALVAVEVAWIARIVWMRQ
jgi:hypothetical protein